MSANLRRVFLAVLALCAGVFVDGNSSTLQAAEPKKYTLAYKFQSGQVFTYDVKQETEMTTQFNDLSEETKNSAEFRRHFKVVAVNTDGSAELETSIDWVRMNVTFNNDPSSAIVFKSDDEKFHHPKFKHLLGSFGKPQAIVHVNRTGQTLKVRATEDANKAVVVDGNADANPAQQTLSVEGYLMRLPEKELAVGETWKERCEVRVLEDKLPVQIDMLRTCKLVKVEKGVATLKFQVAVITPGTTASIRAQLIQREPTGEFQFDMEKGIVIASKSGVDGRVVGPFDGKGSMQATSTFKERLVTPQEVAEKPSESTIK